MDWKSRFFLVQAVKYGRHAVSAAVLLSAQYQSNPPEQRTGITPNQIKSQVIISSHLLLMFSEIRRPVTQGKDEIALPVLLTR